MPDLNAMVINDKLNADNNKSLTFIRKYFDLKMVKNVDYLLIERGFPGDFFKVQMGLL